LLIPRKVMVLVGTAFGALMIADYFLKVDIIQKTAGEVLGWVLVIAGAALLLASLNLVKVQIINITQKRRGWQYSIVVVAAYVAMVFTGLMYGKNSASYKFLFNDVMAPVGTTLNACMIFFISSASYRSFRARNYQAAVLLVAAALVLLGGAPAGAVVHSRLPAIRDWFLEVATVAGNRGIVLASAIGTIALGFKVLLGIDKGHLGGGE